MTTTMLRDELNVGRQVYVGAVDVIDWCAKTEH